MKSNKFKTVANYKEREGEIYETYKSELVTPVVLIYARVYEKHKFIRFYMSVIQHIFLVLNQLFNKRNSDWKHKRFQSYAEFTLVWRDEWIWR